MKQIMIVFKMIAINNYQSKYLSLLKKLKQKAFLNQKENTSKSKFIFYLTFKINSLYSQKIAIKGIKLKK